MISIVTQPNSILQSANNSSVFVISGSAGVTSSVFDFKYIADVYAGGNKVTTLKTFPDSNGFGMFDMRNIVPNLVSFDFVYNISQDSASIFHTGSNSSANIQLIFGKEFSLPGGGFSQSRSEASSSAYFYINSSLPFAESVTTNLSASYFIGDTNASTTRKFLTTADFPIPTYSSLRNYLYYFSSGEPVFDIQVNTFDANNNQLGKYFIVKGNIVFDGVTIIATGLPQLSALPQGTGSNHYQVISGDSIMMNSRVDSYTISLDGNSHILCQPVTYKVMQDCSRFAPYAYKVFWLSDLGSFNSWLFNKVSLKTSTKTQSSYKKIPGMVNSNGSYSLNTYDRGVIPYYTQMDSKIELSTDFLTDKQVKYLKGLFGSPVIFIEGPDGVLISANIDTSDYTLNQRAINKKIFSLSLIFVPSSCDYRQSL